MDDGAHVIVPHAEFVARRHRRLRVNAAFQGLAADQPDGLPVPVAVDQAVDQVERIDRSGASSTPACGVLDKNDDGAGPLAFPTTRR